MSERTKNDFLRAYNVLIRRTSMDHITVNMLCQEAGVSKATFYRHFKDKYDVMNYNYKVLLDTLTAPGHCRSYLELYEKLYIHGKKNWKFLRNAFDTVGINSFCDYIAAYSSAFAEKVTKKNRDGKGLTEAERLQLDVFTVGVSAMYKHWIFDCYKLTPGEAAQALFDIMPPTLREMPF